MASRMPVLGDDDAIKIDSLFELVDRGEDLAGGGDCQRSTLTEVVLGIDNNQCSSFEMRIRSS